MFCFKSIKKSSILEIGSFICNNLENYISKAVKMDVMVYLSKFMLDMFSSFIMVLIYDLITCSILLYNTTNSSKNLDFPFFECKD